MKILVIGTSGQLGNEILRLLSTGQAEIGPIPDEYMKNSVEVTGIDIDDVDISDRYAIDHYFKDKTFDLIINCAAYTNVDGCEQNKDIAYGANAEGPKYLAQVAKKIDAKLVQVSTDYVFSGNNEGERVESDATNPISVYGKSKLEGEQAVEENMERYFIVRTAWLYGYIGKNFVKTILNLSKNHDEVTVVDDQVGNPTSANDLAYEILKIALTDNYGIYHVTNEGICSWADFASAIMQKAHTRCRVERCSSKEYKLLHPESADRPHFSSLKNKHLEDSIGNEMRNWQDALGNYLDNFDALAN